MKTIIKKSSFRLTGYLCTVCGVTMLVYNNDPAPIACEGCGATTGIVKKWDNEIHQTTEVTPIPVDTVVIPPAPSPPVDQPGIPDPHVPGMDEATTATDTAP